MCLLKLNSSCTRGEYVTIATRVLAGYIEKYSINLETNFFIKLKLPAPMLRDLSMTKTKSILDEAIKREKDVFALCLFVTKNGDSSLSVTLWMS